MDAEFCYDTECNENPKSKNKFFKKQIIFLHFPTQVISKLSRRFYIKKCWEKNFSLYQNSIKNGSRSFLGPKEARNKNFNHFWVILDQTHILKKKVPENVLKCSKMPYFQNFNCEFFADIGR